MFKGNSIKSFENQIKKHEEKIKNFSGNNDWVIGYWKGEIKRFEKAKIKKFKK